MTEAQQKDIATPVPDSAQDPWLYKLIIAFLGLTMLATVIGGIILSFTGKPLDGAVIAIGAGAMGALGTTLSPRIGAQ